MVHGVLVTVGWEAEILAVRRVDRGPVIVGSGAGSIAQVPEEALGARCWTVAVVDGAAVNLHPPQNARVVVERAREGGGPEDALRAGDVATLWLGRFSVRIEALDRDDVRPIPRSRTGGAALAYVVLAAVVHGGLLGWARAAPAESSIDDGASQGQTLRDMILAAERRASADAEVTRDGAGLSEGTLVDGHAGDGSRAGGARAPGQQGASGSPLSRASGKRFAASAAADAPTPAREAGDADFTATMVGLIAASARAPAAAFGADLASADDPLSSVGSMWAPSLGESFGSAALGLSGIGLGGGGEGEGIGLGTVGTLGHGAGEAGTGTGGAGARLIARGRTFKYNAGYRCYGCGVSVSGRLPPEIIQRIIRQNMGRIRLCYETALRKNPSLSGRVTTSFVIGRDGSVSSVRISESTIGNRSVDDCVARAFSSMSFPQPEGGIVTVVYPIAMTADDPQPQASYAFTP
jgi:TonB family protein